MRRISFFLFLFLPFFIRKNFSVICIRNNTSCPPYERYKNPDPWSIRFKRYCFEKLTEKPGFFYYPMPQEVIDKANKTDSIEVSAYQYQLLKNEAEKNRKYFNQSIVTLVFALIKKRLGFSYPTPSSFEEETVIQAKDKEQVTEHDIVSFIPFVQGGSFVGESNPPCYTFLINNQARYFSDKITSVLYAYDHFSSMVCLGWIRCAGPGIYFRPRYFKESAGSTYCWYYGPCFRETICPNDPPHGALVRMYKFKQDPESRYSLGNQRLVTTGGLKATALHSEKDY